MTELQVDAALGVALLTDMLRVRRMEEKCAELYGASKIRGFLHLYIGQEAVAVGTISLGGPDDHFITAYRDHGHALAVGMNMNECMAEMFGKATGCARGRGGSMHLRWAEAGNLGAFALTGARPPLAGDAGAAADFATLAPIAATNLLPATGGRNRVSVAVARAMLRQDAQRQQ